MFVLLLVLWIIFNGRITGEIVLFGVAVSALVFWFLCRYMDYGLKRELMVYRGVFGGVRYAALLVYEIFKANFYVMKLIVSSKYIVEPKIIRFRTKLKSETARVVLANSITLTPGTITVMLEGDEYLIHCLDGELGEGIEDSAFVKRLEELEDRSRRKADAGSKGKPAAGSREKLTGAGAGGRGGRKA